MIKFERRDMILKCKCGKVTGLALGKRFLIGNWIGVFFIGGCGVCKTLWIWFGGKGVEIKIF
jgi:hypothetical protein